MAEEKKDVESLYDELNKTLENDSEEEEASGASAEKPKEEADDSKPNDGDENAELSEEEISKLSPRAQKRIRDLAEEVKKLAEKPEPEKPEENAEDKETKANEFDTIDAFLTAVEDEPSRKLLETFYKVVRKELSSTLSPLEAQQNEVKFETAFKDFENIEGIEDYKNDLKKTFMRDPSKPLKALVGEVLVDLQSSKIKPTESKPSSPNHSGKVDTDGLSKDELYATLENLKE